MSPLAEGNLLWKQAIVWVANIIVLVLICLGLRIRGQNCTHFGLNFGSLTWRTAWKTLLMSLLVFVLAIIGFIIGSIIMANITGIPESSADMSGYAYMKDNFPMFILSLLGVLIVSSFGEEVIYRGFLINRLSELGLGTKASYTLPVIFSSIIFGLVHYEWGPMGIVQTTFMGLALGICYIKMKKKLWIMILAHAYMDTVLMLQMYLSNN